MGSGYPGLRSVHREPALPHQLARFDHGEAAVLKPRAELRPVDEERIVLRNLLGERRRVQIQRLGLAQNEDRCRRQMLKERNRGFKTKHSSSIRENRILKSQFLAG